MNSEIHKKADAVAGILIHLRDTRTSLSRAARRLAIPRRTLKKLVDLDWDEFSVSQLQEIQNIVEAMPRRRFALVSHRIEGWRTPPAKMRAQDASARTSMLRYFKYRPNERDTGNPIPILKSQADRD